MLYKYPQQEYPYEQLLLENRRRGRNDPEFEIQDTGVFSEQKYFDVFIEYAKASPEDILLKITAINSGRRRCTPAYPSEYLVSQYLELGKFIR